nr:MAG TPA: hypothetical protein [Caudoviricetes sp.]
MKTVDELKQEFVDHIATLDKTSMTLVELGYYAELLRKADDLFRPSYTDMMAGIGLAPFAMAARKEGAKNG